MGRTGPNAAGKGEVARLLEERGYTYHSLSDVIREECERRGLPTTRDNLVLIGNEIRRNEGVDGLVSRLAARLQLPAVIDSIRNPGEVEALRRIEGFVLLAVTAPDDLRFARLRARRRAGDVDTLEAFRDNEARENSGDRDRQRIRDTVAMADATVVNDGDLTVLATRLQAALDALAAPTK